MSKVMKLAASALAVFSAGVLYPSTASAAISVSSTIDDAVAPFTPTTGRVTRDGIASTCGSAKAYPGAQSAGTSFAYRTITANYAGVPACVAITLTPTATCTGSAQAYLVAYSTFNPASLGSNYLGDSGVSTTTTASPVSLSLDMTSGPIDIVVMTPSTAAGACSYTVTSTLLNAGAPVPTLSEWAMAGLAGLMMIGGAFFLRRRNLTQKI